MLVGPSHRAAFPGVAVQARGEWETPLGRVAIDEADGAGAARRRPGLVFDDPGVHRDEHSLEMQMPFLQRLVPALRDRAADDGQPVAEEVRAWRRRSRRRSRDADVLLVASSDLSHYEPAPVANRLDAVVVEQVGRFDEEGLLARLERHENVACGGGPIVAVMKAARALGADRATVLRYADSGDVGEGDKSQVVGLPLGRPHGERLVTRDASDASPDELSGEERGAAAARGARGDRGALCGAAPELPARRGPARSPRSGARS